MRAEKSPDVIVTGILRLQLPLVQEIGRVISDRLVRGDKDFSLRLIQDPVLSLGSVPGGESRALAVRALRRKQTTYRFSPVRFWRAGPSDRAGGARRGDRTQNSIARRWRIKPDSKI